MSTNLEQGQGYIEDDVQTLEESGELDEYTETWQNYNFHVFLAGF